MEDPLPLSPTAQDILNDMKKKMEEAAKTVESHVSEKPITRMDRFPRDLMGIGGGGQDGRYVVPTLVAMGPYHHGKPHLEEMEEVKRAAAYRFCRDCRRSVNEVYRQVLSIASAARHCYTSTAGATTNDKSLVVECLITMSDAHFAAMMFLDGCFLLQFMAKSGEPPLVGLMLSSGPTLMKDLLLLENQIPWLVLEALSRFMRSDDMAEELARGWMGYVAQVYFSNQKEKESNSKWWLKRFFCNAPPTASTTQAKRMMKCTDEEKTTNGGDPKPPHLLSLLRSIMIDRMPPERREGHFAPDTSLPVSSGAVYLAQIGIKITPSTATWFADMQVKKKPLFFGRLSLSPLFLNDAVACLLVNLAALEVAQATAASNVDSDGYVVCSYLSVLAMLMDREEDVQQLRGRGVLCGHFSNTEMLAFFKCHAKHLRLGFNYFTVVRGIDKYMSQRPLTIAVHKFVYNNFKLIVAVLSIASVLVGIFKAIYSIKHT